MKSTLSLIVLASSMAFSSFLVSCGEKDGAGGGAETSKSSKENADSISDEMVANMDELIAAIESAKDEESAKKAATKINSIADQVVAIAGRLEALGEPSEADKQLVKEKMDKAEAANKEKIMNAFKENMQKPGVGPVISKAMQDFSSKVATAESTFKKYGKEDE